MTRKLAHRLTDIETSIEAIHSHLRQGDLSEGIVFDAVRMRLLEIGEAVKALPISWYADEPEVAWSEIARMRDVLAHRYFDTIHAIVQGTVENDLVPLQAAVARLLQQQVDAEARVRR